jgi:hypothetical protein
MGAKAPGSGDDAAGRDADLIAIVAILPVSDHQAPRPQDLERQ